MRVVDSAGAVRLQEHGKRIDNVENPRIYAHSAIFYILYSTHCSSRIHPF